MNPEIKTIKELNHQIALGLVKLGGNIPGRIKREGRSIKTYKLSVGGRIHTILSRAVELGGTIPRTEITKITNCEWTSRHIAHAEVLGLIKRTCPYKPQNGRKFTYKITKEGKQANDILDSSVEDEYIFMPVPVKVNRKAYFYHATLSW